MLRLDPDVAKTALKDPNVRPMDFTGRPMKNFVFVSPQGTKTEARLRRHVQSSLDFVETLPAKSRSKR